MRTLLSLVGVAGTVAPEAATEYRVTVGAAYVPVYWSVTAVFPEPDVMDFE
jgi:hypothetical protein